MRGVCSLFLVVGCASAQVIAQAPSVVGRFVLAGDAVVPPGVRTTLASLTSGGLGKGGADGARLLVLMSRTGAATGAAPDDDPWRAGFARVQRMDRSAEASAVATAIDRADALWLEGADPTANFEWLRAPAVTRRVHALLERGGVVGAHGSAVGVVGGIAVPGDDGTVRPGLAWLEDCIVAPATFDRAALAALVRAHPGSLGMRVGAVQLRGRLATAVAGRAAEFYTPAGGDRPERWQTVQLGGSADFRRLLRAARSRARPAVRSEPAPLVADGAVFIAGGGELPDAIWAAFVEAAGGADARIGVVAIASAHPKNAAERVVRACRGLGAGAAVISLSATPLRDLTGVWFCGDRPWVLIDQVEDRPIAAALTALLAGGGAVGGSSAVVATFGTSLLRGDPLDENILFADGYDEGLGLLPGFLLEPHCAERDLVGGLDEVALARAPALALGVDEGTVAVVRGGTVSVIGTGGVALVRSKRDRPKPVRFALRSGDSFDFMRWAPR